MNKFYLHLKSLGYGTVIEYKKEIWFFSVGLCGDIVTSATGHCWHFVSDYSPNSKLTDSERRIYPVNWKNYKVLFSPNNIS